MSAGVATQPAQWGERSLSRMLNKLGSGERPIGWALAACRPGTGVDATVFFPADRGGSHAWAQAKAAKAICADCPARQACLAFALEANEQHGIWGGLTVRERDRLPKQGSRSAS